MKSSVVINVWNEFWIDAVPPPLVTVHLVTAKEDIQEGNRVVMKCHHEEPKGPFGKVYGTVWTHNVIENININMKCFIEQIPNWWLHFIDLFQEL